MARFRVIFIQKSENQAHEGWAVQEVETSGNSGLSLKLFPTKEQAQAEADRLTAQDPSNA